jgi:hypothetical protein
MRTKFTLCAIFALSALLGGCEDTRTAEFCGSVCECNGDDPGEVAACTNQCTQSIDALESSNSGAPVVTDECYACATTATCEIALVTCSSECATLLQALNNSPQPGDPIDTTN